MLLGCLVGVIVFLSFAMGVLSLASKIEKDNIPDHSRLLEKRKNLLEEKKKKEEDVANLTKESGELRNKISEKEKDFEKIKLPEKEQEKKEELISLKKRLDELLRLIKTKQDELEKIKQELAGLEEYGKKEEDLKKLREELEALKRKKKDKEEEIAKTSFYKNNAMIKEIEELRKAIKEAEEKMKELKNKLKEGNDPVLEGIRGSLSIKNPLFVECKNNMIILHPDKKALTVSDLGKNNTFSNINVTHRGIVFFIRPDGFDTFNESFGLAQKIADKSNLDLAYEPIDSDYDLDSLIEKLGKRNEKR